MTSEQLLALARDLRGTDLKAMGAPTGFVVRQCPVCEAEGYGRVEATVGGAAAPAVVNVQTKLAASARPERSLAPVVMVAV